MADEQVGTIWLTQEAYDAASAELEHLKGPGRAAVTAKIARARDEGDLSENAGYHAARDEQGQQELRIRQLEAMLRQAQVGEAPSGDEVSPGCLVTIAYDDDPDDTDTFLLGSRELMALDDSTDTEVFSPQSPLGTAIIGHRIGEKVSYSAPNGKPIEVTILEVQPYQA
ncbi:MAG: transcription elongation factor GreA [Micropruina sp.]|nr:transcription elongation factor GreA [Micropruina sp.]